MSEKILNFCNISGETVKKFEGVKKYIATGDIIDNKISSYSEVDYNNKPSRANQIAKIGEVIFAKMKDTIKVITINSENSEYIYSTGFYIIQPKESVLTEYLYWLFNSPKFNIDKNKYCKGATQKALNNEGLSKIEINKLPDIKEQENIVYELNEINEILNKKKEQLKALEELIKSQFVEMFGNPVLNEKQWKIELFGNLGSFKNGMNFNKSDNGYKIRFLGVGDFNKGTIIHNIETLDIIDLKEKPSKEYMLEDKDIIFVRSNGSKELVGRSTLIDGIKDEITYSGFCIRYRKNTEEINTRYLIELFQNKEFFDYLKKDSRGANINNINQQMLSNLKIILPPIELQNKFADFVKQIDKQKFESEIEFRKIQKNIFYKWGR